MLIPTLNFEKLLPLLMLVTASGAEAQVLIASPNYTYTQDFGTSVISASGANNITSGTANLNGWSYDAAFSGEVNITAAAPTNTGGRYGYTLNGNNNRKIGARPSAGTGKVNYGVLFRNTSGQTIQSFSVSYTGFQLSLGGNTSADVNKLTVDYIVSTSSIAITASGGTAIPALDFSQTQFVSSSNTGGQGAGYPAATGTAANSGCVSVAASIPDNSYLLVRWTDPDDPQNDPHLAIDNVQVIFFTNQTVSNNAACSFLPVELLDFYVSSKVSGNDISWKVAQEDQISSYMLEKSINGIDFVDLGTIDHAGVPEAVKTYSFTDVSPEEITYYRLSTIANNGNRTAYKVISQERNQTSDWTYHIYQNENVLMAIFVNGIPKNGNIEVYDFSGNLVSANKIEDAKQTIDISTVGQGLYFIKIISQSKTEYFKLYINK